MLHMHLKMADNARAIQSREAVTASDFWNPNPVRTREIIMSGAADYRSNWERVEITDADRELVCKFMGV